MKRIAALLTLLVIGLPLNGADKETEKKDPPAARVTISGELGMFAQVSRSELKDGKVITYDATDITLADVPGFRIALRKTLLRSELVKIVPGMTAEGNIRPEDKEIVMDGTVRGRDEKEKDKNLAKGQAIVEGELVKDEKGGLTITNGKWPITITGDKAGKIAELRGKVRVTGKLRLTEKKTLEIVAEKGEKAEEVKEKKDK
jgi:hypothetical protein